MSHPADAAASPAAPTARFGPGDLALLESLALSLARAAGPPDAAQALLAAVVPPGGAGVVLAGPEVSSLPVLAEVGVPVGLPRVVRPGGSPAVEAALATGQPQTTDLAGLGPALADLSLAHLSPADLPLADLPVPGAVVVVPLQADGRVSGVLVLLGPTAPLPVLQRAAEHGVLALRAGWLLEQVQRLAATDGLTKIANRRTFETTLEREIARSLRSGEPLSLVLLDLDHFKQLNDTHGHPAGDEVLRNAAFALTCECRDFDTAARFGGEEFAVVLPGCGPEEAADAAERLRCAVAAAPAPAGVRVTASAGVATFPQHGQGADALVRAADEALYRAKAAGRDCSAVSTGPTGAQAAEELLRAAVLARLAAVTPDRPG